MSQCYPFLVGNQLLSTTHIPSYKWYIEDSHQPISIAMANAQMNSILWFRYVYMLHPRSIFCVFQLYGRNSTQKHIPMNFYFVKEFKKTSLWILLGIIQFYLLEVKDPSLFLFFILIIFTYCQRVLTFKSHPSSSNPYRHWLSRLVL